jgi:hypothetical protein
MMRSRGMGAINPAKVKKFTGRDEGTRSKTKKLADGGFLEDEAMGQPMTAAESAAALSNFGYRPAYEQIPSSGGSSPTQESNERRPGEIERNVMNAMNALGPGRLVAGGIRAATAAPQAARAAGRELELMTRPKVTNVVAPDLRPGKAGAIEGKYAVRNLMNYQKGLQEIEDIKRTGYMMPSPKEVKSGSNRKWFTQTDEPNKAHFRVLAENVPPNRAVRRKDIEVYDPVKGDYVPLKKGGKVSASRGDGIAKRGKTKGRIV